MKKIAIYNYCEGLFGRFCRSWQKNLEQCGYSVYVHSDTHYNRGDKPLPTPPEEYDIHFIVGAGSILRSLGDHGFPKNGKTILWNCEPFVDDPKNEHYWKAELLTPIANKFACIICMNKSIEKEMNSNFPNVHTFRIPYLIDSDDITPPLPENDKITSVLQLGRKSKHRENIETLFMEKNVPATFIYDGKYGKDKYECISKAKICVNLHMNPDTVYFNQHRIFEAWAAGSVVVSEQYGSLSDFGIELNKHLIVGDVSDLPYLCKALLADHEKRHALAEAAQTLLREKYTTEKWYPQMMEIVSTV